MLSRTFKRIFDTTYLQKSASIQPRTSLSKFACDLEGIWKFGGGENPRQIQNNWNVKCEPRNSANDTTSTGPFSAVSISERVNAKFSPNEEQNRNRIAYRS